MTCLWLDLRWSDALVGACAKLTPDQLPFPHDVGQLSTTFAIRNGAYNYFGKFRGQRFPSRRRDVLALPQVLVTAVTFALAGYSGALSTLTLKDLDFVHAVNALPRLTVSTEQLLPN